MNQTLSEKRAQAIKDQLVTNGIPADRMELKGMGADQPIADNKSEDGRKQNRRVTIKKLK